MRKMIAIILSCVLVFSVTGCSDSCSKESESKSETKKENKYVTLVKESKNSNYSDITYDTAFKNFFSNSKWEYFKGERTLETNSSGEAKTTEDCDIVEFTGKCTFEDEDAKMLIQFDIDKSRNEFEPRALTINGKEYDMIDIDGVIGKVFGEYEEKLNKLPKKSDSHEKAKIKAFAECMKTFSDPPVGTDDDYYKEQYNSWKNKEGYYSIVENKDGTFKHIDYNSEYSSILEEYEESDDDYYSDYYSAKYGLYDLDRNGTYELIISYGTNEADWSNAVYEYTDSGTKYIGEISGSVGLYEAENREGIYAVRGKMGSQTIRRITLNNDELNDVIILEEDVGEGDYYSNDNSIDWTDIFDHSTLEYM